METSTANDQSCKRKTIEVCAAYRNLNDDESNMALIEVKLVTGYVPVKDDLVKMTRKGFKRYEVDGRTVTFYAEKFTKDYLCATFRVIREYDVENPAPGIAEVFDYYEPGLRVSKVKLVYFF